jgi:type IV secretion system protein VirB9
MNPIRLLAFGVSAIALAACAAKGAAPPEIAYDSDAFQAATALPEPPSPVEIVTIPEPLPLPGQLKPLPPATPARADSRLPAERVDDANEAARQEPSRDFYVDAVQVYAYAPGALYRLYTAPEQVSDIALQPGERLIAVSAGDTVRWVLGDTTSGSGESEQVHILVKPVAAGLETTEDTYMAALSWHYPHDRLMALRQQNRRAQEASGQVIDEGLALDRLQFRYEITGDTPPWRPVRAFDDARKVYIEFPRRIDQGEAPPLFVVGPDGGIQLVNYRISGNYYIVDRLFGAAELRLGEDPQQVVRIVRTDGRRASAPAPHPTEAVR